MLRVGDGYLVIATGRTATFHFRVTLGETVAEPEGEVSWCVVVEEQRGTGDGRSWSLSETFSFPDQEAAEAEALRLAREYQPVYPWSPKSRRVCGPRAGTW